MIESSVSRILSKLGPNDVVLDIGSWAQCFNRADYVLDMGSYETRNYHGQRKPYGDMPERFTDKTWIVRDICDKTPYPFADKSIDFVICSHTLEDVRDPLWVCSEMARIAKRGYIEVPSRLVETCRGVDGMHVGCSHHRWLIDINDSHIRFMMKYHAIHGAWNASFPSSVTYQLKPDETIQFLFWENDFSCEEFSIHGNAEIETALTDYVEKQDRMTAKEMRREYLRERLRSLTPLIDGKLAGVLARVVGRLI